jgi:hypothetical protein
VFLADDFVGLGDPADKDVESACAQYNGNAFSGGQPFAGARRNGPNDRMSLLGATVGTIIFSR